MEIKTKTKINSGTKTKIKTKINSKTKTKQIQTTFPGGGPAGSDPPPLFYPLLPARPTLTHNLAGYDFFQPVRNSLIIVWISYKVPRLKFVPLLMVGGIHEWGKRAVFGSF